MEMAAEPFESTLVQTDKILEVANDWVGYHPTLHEFPGTVTEYGNFVDPYNRVLPVRFQGDFADTGYYPVDTFTQNILNKYAIEGIEGKKEKDPRKTGSFYLTKDLAREASKEVLCTNMKLCKEDGEAYLASHYEECWDYYDVNREGKIDAIGVSQFFRFLTKPLGTIDLQ